MKNKINIYIEADSMAVEKKSGIGYLVASMVLALDKILDKDGSYTISLFVSWSQWKRIKSYKLRNIKCIRLPLPAKLLNVLSRLPLCPPMDILGKGIYVFPNYKNWPLARSKSITFVHDVAYAINPKFIEPKNLEMLRNNLPKWVQRTDKIATISENSAKEIQQVFKISQNKIAVMSCGVNKQEFYHRPEIEIDTIKEKYHLPSRYFFYLSNLEPRKNILTLISAYSKLPRSILNDCGLLIVGGMGWLNSDILDAINIAQKKGLKIIHPDIYVPDEDLPALHSGSVALIQPSYHEGFGLSILQAMACSTPVILSDIPTHKEVADSAGAYFNPTDQFALRNLMASIANDNTLRKDLAIKCLKRSRLYSWDSFANELLITAKHLAE